jgi:hypothetical protein
MKPKGLKTEFQHFPDLIRQGERDLAAINAELLPDCPGRNFDIQ